MLRRLGLSWLSFGLALVCSGHAEEWNAWPLSVRLQADDAGRPKQTDFLGPFASLREFEKHEVFSVRPFYTRFEGEERTNQWHFLYPLFNYYDHPHGTSWHSLNLIRGGSYRGGSYRDGEVRDFELFPLLFYRNTGEEDSSYAAVFPLGGTLKNRLFRDRIDFALWPLFVRTERRDEIRHHTPYPFIQRLSGPESRGFGVWPIYGQFERDNHYRRTWLLWPFVYHYEDRLDQEVPYVRSGFWPVYTQETAEGLESASFVWPFFGYTRKYEPRPVYSEARLLWPFWVQGRGEHRHVNRVLPLFAHETAPGYQKNWFLWPFLRIENEEFANMTTRTDSFLFLLYRGKTHQLDDRTARSNSLWPLYGYWYDGDENRQLQLIDPFTVLFASNEVVRENWSPLFAVYRFDRRGESRRHSLLWNLIVHQSEEGKTQRFHLGPLFDYRNQEDESRWQILGGLFGINRTEDGRRLRLFWNDL